MRKLYLQLYLALVGIVILCLLIAAITMHMFRDRDDFRQRLVRGVVELVLESLPDPGSAEYENALRARSRRLGVHFVVFSPARDVLSHTTERPIEFPSTLHNGFFMTGEYGGLVVQLDDGRWVAALVDEGGRQHHDFGVWLLAFAILMAAACYPVARGITGRLERLKQSVEAWGRGDLDRRARVEGKDEVAALAMCFNQAAAHIEELVARKKQMLASASHELRSPLARVRMAAELMPGAEPERQDELQGQIEEDIAELDGLIEDLLLAARAESDGARAPRAQVDLFRLVEQEAARLSVVVQGEQALVRGDERMLRRLIRNLLENARRHGGGEQIEVTLTRSSGSVHLTVQDRGPGVPEAERERIFEPFYRAHHHAETKQGGVGLGLSLVRQIAAHHGGTAKYQSRPGGGSCFLVSLPLERE